MARKAGGLKTADEEVSLDGLDYAAEKTNNTSSIGKAINMIVNLLTSQNVPGKDGVVGDYDLNLIGDCCYQLLNDIKVNASTGYGIVMNRQYFQAAGLM